MKIGDVVIYKTDGSMSDCGYAGRVGIIEKMRETTHHTHKHISGTEGGFWLRVRWINPFKRVHPRTGKELWIDWSDFGSWDFYVA